MIGNIWDRQEAEQEAEVAAPPLLGWLRPRGHDAATLPINSTEEAVQPGPAQEPPPASSAPQVAAPAPEHIASGNVAAAGSGGGGPSTPQHDDTSHAVHTATESHVAAGAAQALSLCGRVLAATCEAGGGAIGRVGAPAATGWLPSDAWCIARALADGASAPESGVSAPAQRYADASLWRNNAGAGLRATYGAGGGAVGQVSGRGASEGDVTVLIHHADVEAREDVSLLGVRAQGASGASPDVSRVSQAPASHVQPAAAPPSPLAASPARSSDHVRAEAAGHTPATAAPSAAAAQPPASRAAERSDQPYSYAGGASLQRGGGEARGHAPAQTPAPIGAFVREHGQQALSNAVWALAKMRYTESRASRACILACSTIYCRVPPDEVYPQVRSTDRNSFVVATLLWSVLASRHAAKHGQHIAWLVAGVSFSVCQVHVASAHPLFAGGIDVGVGCNPPQARRHHHARPHRARGAPSPAAHACGATGGVEHRVRDGNVSLQR